MKSKFLILSLSAALAAPLGLQAEPVSVATDPVGYVTMEVPENTNSNRFFSSISVPFQNAAEFQGEILSIDEIEGYAVLEFSTGSLSGFDFDKVNFLGQSLYYLDIISGNSEGLLVDIIDNDSSSLTLFISLSEADLAVGDTISVREYKTISSVFGDENSFGFHSGTDPISSDNIYISGDGVVNTVYYQTDNLGFLGGTGWRISGDSSSDVSELRISPDAGILIGKVPSSTSVSATFSGGVRLNDILLPLNDGFNLVSFTNPVDTELGLLFDDPEVGALQGGASSTESDNIFILNPSTGSYEQFYYQIDNLGFLGGTGWRLSGDSSTDVSDKSIPAGTSVYILNRGAEKILPVRVSFSN